MTTGKLNLTRLIKNAAANPLVEQLKQLMGKQAEYKWHKSKDLHRDVTNGRHYPFSFLTGEAKELVDAIKNRDMANFKEEIGDTSYAAQMLAAQATGLNHPVYADLSKFHNREKIWKDIFKEKGSTYHPKYMEGGSNFAKPSKIIKALASAGIRIGRKEAEKLANKYTGGKMEKEAYAMDPQAFPMREPSFNSPAENIGSLLFGGNFVPSPRDGESIYDSMLRNKRSIELSKLQGNALAGNPMLNRLGLPNNDITKAIGRGAAMFSPQIGEKLSPLLGGNPMQAVKNMMAKQAGLDLMQQVAHYLPAVGGLAAGYASTNLLPRLFQGVVNPMMRKIAPLRGKHTNEMRANLGLQGKVKVLKPKELNVPKGEDQYAMFDPNTNTVEASSMRMFRPGNIAHELGHAHIDHKPGIVNYLQNEIYPIADKYAKRTAPLIGAAAGLASNHHPVAGAVMGGLGGALADSGRLIPEFEATRRGIKAMMQSSLPMGEKLKNSASLIPAYLSYLGQSAGSGAIAGGIAGI